MNRQRRFHIIFAVHYLRYGLLLCLVPMLQALLAFDLDSLWAALRQDAVILLACAAAALALWRATAFRLEDGAVKVTQGVFYRSYHTFGRASIAALEIARPLYCRMLGASRITLYFKTNASPKSYSMFLHKKDAAAVADVLLPVRSDTSVFEPTGFERLSFVMLSANIITSSAFALWGVKQLDEVLGQNFQQIALDTFHEAELFAARYLPTGLAFLVTLGFAVTGFTFCMRCCTRQALRYAGTAESSSAKAALSRSSSGVSWWPVCPPAMCALRRRRAFCGAIRYTFPQAASAEAICPCWSIKRGRADSGAPAAQLLPAGRSAVHACTQKPGAVSLAARHAARSFFGAVRRGLLRNAADSAHAFRTGGACPRWAAGFVGGLFP